VDDCFSLLLLNIAEIKMAFHCRICGMPDFRLSHLRSRDLGRLLTLQYPVRCRTCRERHFVFILRTFKIMRDAKLPRGEESAAKGTRVK